MNRLVLILLVCVVLAPAAMAKWEGADETVVEKFAEEAGRGAKDPLINTDQGDLLLFVFLGAGSVGGFVMGYLYRDLFSKKERHIVEARV